MITVLISTAVRAEKFNLQKSRDNYVSLNECLYALSKGTRLVKGTTDVFVYQNSVWEIHFTDEQQFECNLIGELTDQQLHQKIKCLITKDKAEQRCLQTVKKMTKAELEKLGVKLIPTDVYHVGPYKYSNLNDALAEAGRSSAKHKSTSV